MAKTLYEKLFDAHVVYEAEGETPILYINRHLIHEVTSPQAFDGLRVAGRQVRQVSKTFGTMDHSICLLYTSPSPRDTERSRMPSSA